MMVAKIVSGGQTGADRAGLDAAMESGIPVGGYCPKGRRAEDGVVPDRYPLVELPDGNYLSRTEKNVVESDGTLILNKGKLTGGTLRTQEFALKHGRPYLVVQLDEKKIVKPELVLGWLKEQQIRVLNVAGPRESKFPAGIYTDARSYLDQLFSFLKDEA